MCYLSLSLSEHLTLNGRKCRQGADRKVCKNADTSRAIPPAPCESSQHTPPHRPARPAPPRAPTSPHCRGSCFPILGRPLVCLRHSHSWVGAYLRQTRADFWRRPWWSVVTPPPIPQRCRAPTSPAHSSPLPAAAGHCRRSLDLAAPRTRGQPARDEGKPAEDEGVPRASSHFYGQPEKELETLTKAFQQLVQDSEATAEDDNSRILRSGSTHDRVPPPPPSSLPHDNEGNILTNQESTMATNSIKLLPTTASVRVFADNEPDYSARDFILQCEDVMNNSFVSEPGDKISFIRSRLKPGTEASALSYTSAFVEPQQTKDYAQFRSHFLESFGEDVRHSLVKGVNVAVTKLISAVESKGLFAGQVDAYRLSTDLGSYLRAGGWTEGENMSLSNCYAGRIT
ncbi:uncharacterized protein LOC127000102 [Eriocheir sinensis]|uniref:uncharacterized protein LOC127000102 n=1 Tax=Eriocheir sinensis TaxID=95602 RepID=UPI0021C9898D|nr:uncharacterized protein LOC127000102 [Eriocheir sinensis]